MGLPQRGKNERRDGAVQESGGLPTDLERLRRFLRIHLGHFALGTVRINIPSRRDDLIGQMRDELADQGANLLLRDYSQREVRNLKHEFQDDRELNELLARSSNKLALAVTGIEPWIEAPPRPDRDVSYFLAALNVNREDIVLQFPIPMTFWLTDYAMDLLALGAPDFYDICSGRFRFDDLGWQRYF